MLELPESMTSLVCCSCCARKPPAAAGAEFTESYAATHETEKRPQAEHHESYAPRRNKARKARCVPAQTESTQQQKLMAVGTSTVVEGFLSKFATGVGKNWKRRYFRLHRDGQLEYFDDAYTVQSRGCLQLLNPQGWPQYTIFETIGGKGEHFELQPVNESDTTPALLLAAESASKRDMWIDRISTGFARRSKPVNGPGRNTIAYRDTANHGNLNVNNATEGGEFGGQVVHQGFLSKEGHIVKSWKWRYFVLYENGLLAYYTRRSVDKLKGEMRLWTRGYPNTLTIEVEQERKKNGCQFSLKSGNEYLMLQADTAKIRDEWLYKIQLGIHNNCQDTQKN
jgi:hypothetical protein